MNIEGARIYTEGVEIERETESKIRQIVGTLRTLSPSSDVSMRFLKNGRTYEALLWGKADDIPFGVYRRGPSMSHVLGGFYRRVKKTCSKSRMSEGGKVRRLSKHQAIDHGQLAMAG
jgi:hypothetical protein